MLEGREEDEWRVELGVATNRQTASRSVGKRQELQRAKGEILPPPPPLFASNGVINDTRVCRMK